MAYLIDFPTHTDERGNLTVIEKKIPFEIKRIYYIYNVNSNRGGHRHKKNIQALICLNGKCEIYVNNGEEKKNFLLNSPTKGLILNCEDWHTMNNFSENAILLVFASEYFDAEDYIDEKYEND